MEAFLTTDGVFWRKSIYTRILVTFIIILVPLYLLAYQVFNAASKTVVREITGSMTAQAVFYLDGLEKDMLRIQELAYGLINDTGLNRLAAIPESMNDIERTEAIWSLQDRLEAIRSSSRYIREVNVHIPALERSIQAVGKIDTLDLERYKHLMAAYTPTVPINEVDGEPAMLVASAFRAYGDEGDPLFLIEVRLSPDAFREALSQFRQNGETGAFLYSRRHASFLASIGTDGGIVQEILDDSITGIRGGFRSRNAVALAVFANSPVLGMTLGIHMPDRVAFTPIRQYSVWFVLFSFAALIVILLFTLSLNQWIRKPFQVLIHSFRQVEAGNLDVAVRHHHDDEYGLLYGRFNDMVEKIRTLIDQVYKVRILAQRAELKQLQSQINPHFLYNSFFILHRRIKSGDLDNAARFSQQLGQYFRFITKNDSDEIPLSRECEHALVYVGIQQTRYGSRISVDADPLPERQSGLSEPFLSKQPILETAYEHGLRDQEADGQILIRFLETETGCLCIRIEDNGNGADEETIREIRRSLDEEGGIQEHTGLVNIHRRLRLKFGTRSGVEVGRSPLGGIRVDLKLAVTPQQEEMSDDETVAGR